MREGILEILDQSKGYDTALLTTFNFDIEFFERAVFSRLVKNNIRRVSLFVDAEELTKAIQAVDTCVLGLKYAVNPVYMHGAFHPKVILLLGARKARLILGSANITLSGYCINNEIYNCIDYETDHIQYRDVICSAIRFFIDCNQYTPSLDRLLLDSLSKYPYNRPCKSNEEVFFIDNGNRSVVSQLSDIIKEEILTIRVSAPYYDNGLFALQTLRHQFPKAHIKLYLQRGKSTFPEDVQRTKRIVDEISVFDEVQSPEYKNHHFYHGKVFEFESSRKSYILYGSSNCTQSALTLSKMEDGNYECNILAVGSAGKFDFFDCFMIIDDASTQSRRMEFESQPVGNYAFRYGIADEKGLRLHFNRNTEYSDLKIFLATTELKWRRENKEVVAILKCEEVQNVFDLSFKYAGTEEKVRCWVNDVASLELFRISVTDHFELQDSDDFGKGDRFREDYENYFRAESVFIDEIKEENRCMALFARRDSVSDEDTEISESGESFVIQVAVTDDDFVAYNRYKVLEQIRGRISARFLYGESLYFDTSRKAVTRKGDEKLFTEKIARPRKPNTEEKQFARFIKRRVRGMLGEKFLQDGKVDAFRYLGLASVVCEILEKYNRKERIEDMFSNEYVIETRSSLMMNLIGLLSGDDKDDGVDAEAIIARCFDVILDNHSIAQKFENEETKRKCEAVNRKLLMALEEKFHRRSQYEESLRKLAGKDIGIQMESAQEYLEALFGYKELKGIQSFLERHYGKESTIKIDGEKAEITIVSDNPGDHLRPDSAILREIVRYSLHSHTLTYTYITIHNSIPSSGQQIAAIQHKINMFYGKRTTTIVRGNGQREERTSFL